MLSNIRECKYCGDEFDWRQKQAAVGGYSTVCEDCTLEDHPDKDPPVIRGVISGDGKQASIDILKFDNKDDADAYCKAWNNNSGWNNQRSGGLSEIDFITVGRNGGNSNHKGRL